MQAIAMAQTDFEGLFVSLQAAAHPGSCLRPAAARRRPLTNENPSSFHDRFFVSLLRFDYAAGSAQRGAQMSIDDAAREELGFIAEHLKVMHATNTSRDITAISRADAGIVQSVLAGKKLIMRRLRFCNSKINSLQSELNEALQLNMSGATPDARRMKRGVHMC